MLICLIIYHIIAMNAIASQKCFTIESTAILTDVRLRYAACSLLSTLCRGCLSAVRDIFARTNLITLSIRETSDSVRTSMAAQIRIGTSGFSYKEWPRGFYPAKL